MSSSILVGITGGISAYKIPLLVRLMVKAGMNVQVVMTRAATKFVTPMTLATLSGNPVYCDMWGERDRPSVEHISSGRRCEDRCHSSCNRQLHRQIGPRYRRRYVNYRHDGF